ncbi:MAG TPA: Ku protein [Hyphomicrobiales bacterium]|nr:Ku protein [Hyphomicrobiales bacterium]
MAPRPSWKGYLKLSLVSCAVALYPATTSSERVSFHTLNRATKNRLRQQMVDEDTGEVVEREDRVRGFEVAKGEYIVVEDEELDQLQLESTHTIDIERFVPIGDVDELYRAGAHYLAPDDKVAQEAFAVIREAMLKEKVAGIGKVVLSRHERMLLLEPRGKGLLASTLRPASEVRSATPYFEDIEDVAVPEDMLDLAAHIIAKKKGKFDPKAFEDRYETAVKEMLLAKQKGRPLPKAGAAPPSNVINLMDALRRSVESDSPRGTIKKPKKEPAKAPRKAKAPARKKAAGGR